MAWRQLAEVCERYLHKGSKVYIEGGLTQRKFTDREGVQRTSVEVIASDVEFLSASQSSAATGDTNDPFLYVLRYGRCVVYQEWWHQQPEGDARLSARLTHMAPASWRQVRQETRDSHQEQLNRFRFRHRPLAYLASLELRWEQASCTGVLPP